MVAGYIPEQGDIILVDFDPSKGHEQQGRRPAVVVSNDILNGNSPFVWVVPITHGDWPFPTHVRLDDRTKTDGVVYVEQLIMIDFHYRKVRKIDKLPQDKLEEILDYIHQITELV